MNIFYLDKNPVMAAQYHCDQHVVKMILETAQMLSTAHRVLDGIPVQYCKIPADHPVHGPATELSDGVPAPYCKIPATHPASGSSKKVRVLTRYVLWDHRDEVLYEAAHVSHPCTKWVRETIQNYSWTYCLLRALLWEKKFRWPNNREHKTARLLSHLATVPKNTSLGTSAPAQAMPDIYKRADTVEAYRSYYVGDKKRFATWRHRRSHPYWWK